MRHKKQGRNHKNENPNGVHKPSAQVPTSARTSAVSDGSGHVLPPPDCAQAPAGMSADQTRKVLPSVSETHELIFLLIRKNSEMPFPHIMQI